MLRKVKVVTAPTMYDHTPLQYITRSNARRRNWNNGQRRRFMMIWKCCRAQGRVTASVPVLLL